MSILENKVTSDSADLNRKKIEVDKLSDVSNALKEMISLQNMQIQNHDFEDSDIRKEVAKNREEFLVSSQKTREDLIDAIKESLGDSPTRLAVLEHDANDLDEKINKHEVSIEKLTEIANSLKEMVSVQSQRMKVQEQQADHIAAALSERRIEINSQFNTVQATLKDIIANITSDTDRKVAIMLQTINDQEVRNKNDRDKIAANSQAIETRQETVRTQLYDKLETEYDKLHTRLNALEKHRWIMVGAATIALIAFKLVDAHVLTSLL